MKEMQEVSVRTLIDDSYWEEWAKKIPGKIQGMKNSPMEEERILGEIIEQEFLCTVAFCKMIEDIKGGEFNPSTETGRARLENVLKALARTGTLLLRNVEMIVGEDDGPPSLAVKIARSILYKERERIQEISVDNRAPAFSALSVFSEYAAERATNFDPLCLWDIFTEAGGAEWPQYETLEDAISATVEFLRGVQESSEAVPEKQPAPLWNIRDKNISKIQFPVDKVNSKLWGYSTKACLPGADSSITANRNNRRTKTRDVDIPVSITFDQAERYIVGDVGLTHFDKRVYMAASNLYDEDNPVFSVADVYRAMGWGKRPDANTTQKIHDSITKMSLTHLVINNKPEIEANHKYDFFEYDSSLLPMERVKAAHRGGVTENAIRLFREPPLFSFAKQRKQITWIPLDLLQSPLNKTGETIAIEHYLLLRITRAKNEENRKNEANGKKNQQGNPWKPSREFSILLDTVAKEAKIGGKQRSRMPEKIERLLNHYVERKFILSFRFSKEKDKVTITFK